VDLVSLCHVKLKDEGITIVRDIHEWMKAHVDVAYGSNKVCVP